MKRKRETLTTEEMSKLTGATLRQLQVWDEKGVLTAERIDWPRGGARAYRPEQVAIARDLVNFNGPMEKRLELRKILARKGKSMEECLEWLGILRPFISSATKVIR